jgi:hypothetical protein
MSYPLSGRSLYRIKAADLSNETLSSEELSKRVERCFDKPNKGGLSSTTPATST